MTQLDLFGDRESHEADLALKRSAAGRESEQDKQLARVYKGIRAHLIAFRLTKEVGEEWTLIDLDAQLKLIPGLKYTPDSPRRILHALKKDGALDYEIVNRAQGIWKFTK